MAGQAYDKNAGTRTDGVSENTGARSEGNVLEEVSKTPPKERLDIISSAEGKGKDVPQGFKSADGSDATVVQKKVETKSEIKTVQVGAVQVRDMAPGVDSMEAVNVRFRETTEKTTTEVTEKPGESGGSRGHGEAALVAGGAGREGAREAGRAGEKEGHEGERAGAAEAAEGKGKQDGREGHEDEREGAAEAAEGKGKEEAEAAEHAGEAREGADEAGHEGSDANRDAAAKAAEAAGAAGKLVDFQGGTGADARDRHRNPHKRK
jgi:hypothetical protein